MCHHENLTYCDRRAIDGHQTNDWLGPPRLISEHFVVTGDSHLLDLNVVPHLVPTGVLLQTPLQIQILRMTVSTVTIEMSNEKTRLQRFAGLVLQDHSGYRPPRFTITRSRSI